VVRLTPALGSAGQYRAQYEPKRAGKYEIVVEARVSGRILTAEKLVIEVSRPNLEFDRLDLDDRMLGRIAEATGGCYHHLTGADRLLEELSRKAERRRGFFELPLYNPPAFWALFVGALCGEWSLRRRYRLR
jgi:hypothetical protein